MCGLRMRSWVPIQPLSLTGTEPWFPHPQMDTIPHSHLVGGGGGKVNWVGAY